MNRQQIPGRCHLRRWVAALVCVAAWPAVGWADPGPDASPMEKLLLFGGNTAPEWSVAESTVAETRTRVKATPSALHWHVLVDHTAGEALYPIGWPRFNHAIPEGPLRDWSGYDYLHFWLYVETSRTTLPGTPASLILHTPDKAMAYSRTLTEAKKDQWVEVNVPLATIPRIHDVRLIQFAISESNYRHGDTIDFYIDDLSLLRYAQPVLLDFAPESGAVFSDTRYLPIVFRLSGVKPGDQVPVVCRLQREGRTMVETTTTAARGRQRVLLDLGAKRLLPGTYQITAQAKGQGKAAGATLRVVESPW
ncbi:MAG: hypothetical protein QHJ73_04010 [Armatimonadota bacterium]|nr:hypothetical protein [Armatimonadota bacterium]